MGCDVEGHLTPDPESGLSVSSNGSNGLRRLPSLCKTSSCQAFSILERIEWAATALFLEEMCVVDNFQYPRTDRMGCDSHAPLSLRLNIATFSILERIEWAATIQLLAQ